MSKIQIFVTLGTSSINPNFLKFINKKVSLVRLNMSHINLSELRQKILFIKKYCKVPICIDTEGAQIRTKLKKLKRIRYKKGKILSINKKKGKFTFYPNDILDKLKANDRLDIGFEGLKIKLIKKTQNKISFKCLTGGLLENNKGVHLLNRKVKLNYLTSKDFEAIKIAKELNIKNFALSFTNTRSDIINFKKILPNQEKYFKIETKNAIKNLDFFFKNARNFLIDRGDLSKDIGITNIPISQRKIFKKSKKIKNIKPKIAVATNFLESMIDKPFPTRAEVNDIFNALEMGANGLVLAAETAIGKYPKECVKLLIDIIKVFKKNKKNL